MAVPWGGKGIPYADFLIKLTSIADVTIKHSKTSVVDDDGISTIVSLERLVDGQTYWCPVEYSMEGELVQLNVIRSVCSALKIEENAFSEYFPKI